MKARLIVTIVTAALCAQAWAASADRQQYILRLKYLTMLPNASAPAPIKDVVGQLGGQVDFDLTDWLIVTIPEAAFQPIRQHAAVKYLQRVVSGPFVEPTATATSARRVATNARLISNSLPGSSGTYIYDGAGNISAIGGDTFTYDALSRLVQANVKGATETYTYDAFGNLTKKTTVNSTITPPTNLTVDLTTSTATNHLNAEAYDAAGNVTGDSGETNVFDPSNMQLEKDIPGSSLAEIYVYNAADERIGTFDCFLASAANCANATMIWSLRDESGKVLRQYQGTYIPNVLPSGAPAWAWKEDYVYRDGVLLGGERQAEEGGRRHFHLDHLGTPRLVTGSVGQELSQHDYYPFGVEIPPSFQDTANGYDREEPMRFTGHERDFNTVTTSENANYNDFMHARATVPQWGRFLSVDPVIDVKRALQSPQMWNRYAYVVNNPLRYTDPDGREHVQEPGFTNPNAKMDWAEVPAVSWAFYAEGAMLAVVGGAQLNEAVSALYGSYQAWRAASATAATIKAIEQASKTDSLIFQNAINALQRTAGKVDFGKALDALVNATRAVNSSYQVYKIGQIGGQAVYGSTFSKIGITNINGVVTIVKLVDNGYKVLGVLK